MNKKRTWSYGFKQTIFLLLLFAVFCRQGYAQCVTITSGGSNTITACPGQTITLNPTVDVTSFATSTIGYSWTGSGGVTFSPSNAIPTTISMPSTPQTATLHVSTYNNLITNGDFEDVSIFSGWSSDYNRSVCWGPRSVKVSDLSDICGGNCTRFPDHSIIGTHMLLVDGNTNSTVDPNPMHNRVWYAKVNGCGEGSGEYHFTCYVAANTNNRNYLWLWNEDEKPIINIYRNGVLQLNYTMYNDCADPNGIKWKQLSFTMYDIGIGEEISIVDARVNQRSYNNEFVIDDITLGHTEADETFTYYLNPYPVPDPSATISISPSPLCCGTSFSLSINPTTGCGTGCTYSWNFLTGGMPVTGSPVMHDAIPCSATSTPNAVVTMQNSYGCTTLANRPIIVTRPANAGVINGTHDLCQGKVYYFTTTGDPGGIWTRTPPITAPVTVGLFSGVVTASTTGTGPATISYTVPSSGCGPASVASYPVTVHPNPVGAVAYTGSNIICPGILSIPLTGTAGSTIYYSYSLPGTTSSINSSVVVDATGNASLTFSLPLEGSFHLWVSYVDNGYCTTDIKTPIDITVKRPTAAIISQPAPCTGNSFTLTVQGPSGPTALTSGVVRIDPVAPTTGGPWYVHIPPSASLTNIGYVTITPPLGDPGPYLYQVTGGTGYGCPFTIATPITVAVTPIPYPAITFTSNSPICTGDAITFSANCTGGCPPNVHIYGPWGAPSFSAWPVYTGGSPAYTYSIPGASVLNNGIYTLEADNRGCKISPLTIKVKVNPKPTASLTVSSSIDPCGKFGGTVMLHLTCSNPGSTITYSETPGTTHTVTLGGTTMDIPVYLSTSTTFMIISVVSPAGCVGTVSSVPVTAGPRPKPVACPFESADHHCIEIHSTVWGPGVYAYCRVIYGYSPTLYLLQNFPLTGPVTTICTPEIPAGTHGFDIRGVGNGPCYWEEICRVGMHYSTLPFAGKPFVASNPMCSNEPTVWGQTFRAIATTASSSVSYQWHKSSLGGTFSAISGATDSTYTYSPSDSDKLYFVTTDTSGVDTSDTFTVHIYPFPTVNTTFDTITICSGDSVILGVSSPDNNTQYLWSGGATCLDGNCTSASVHPNASTNYEVNAMNLGGCIATHSVYVYVKSSPPLNVIADQTDICSGQRVSFYVYDSYPSVTYSWSGGGINCIGARCDTAVDSPRVTTTYTVTATDISGCSRSTTITVNVHSPHVTMSPDRNEVCGDGTVTLSVDNPDPDAIYTWSGDYTSCSNAECTVVTASVSATTTYSVTMTDMFGCVGVAKHSIDWYELPVIDATVSANNICAGTTITLSASSTSPGYHFVWWDGSSTCTCVSPLCDEITATPVSNTVYQVTAFNPSGCSATAYVFVNMAIPVQAEVDNNMVCPGSTVNLSVADPLPGITYTWDGGSVTCDDGGCYKAHDNPTDITIYTLTATSGDGCSAISTVEVDMFKPMRIDIKQSDDKICLGAKVELGAYIEKGDKYTWSGGEFSCESPECDEILVKPEATTTYTVTAIDENGCIETGTVTINMAIPINVNVASTTVCPGQVVEMSIDNPDPHYQYHWDGGSVECEGKLCEDAHDLLWKTTVYTVTATDEKCSSATTITINVDYFEITPVVDNERVCAGSLVTLSVENPDPTYTYSWSGGNVACTSPDCNMATDNPVSNTAYVLTAVDGFGCTAVNSVEVNMNVPLAVVPSASSICAGQSAVANIDNPSQSISYWWSASSGTFTCLDAQCGAISMQPEATTEYTVTATDANGCTNTSSFVIEVVPLPAVNAIADNATVCSGGTINLSVLSPDPTCTYSWSGDGISCTDPSCYAANGSVSSSSTFTVTATNGSACSSSTAVEVNVYPNAIDVTASQLTICPGNSDTISVIGNGGPYTWYGSGITCLNMLCDSIVVNPFDSAVYYVVVTDSNGCIDTAGVYIDISDSCQTDSFYAKHAQGVNAVEEHFIIAPNPNDGVLTVRGSLAGKQDDELITITVYDISGRLMMSSDAQSYNGIVKQSIQLPDNAANGTYMIKIRTAVSEHVMKFTLNR